MKKSIGFPSLTMGVCYYPEHWDKALWADDLRRMEGYGIRIIRIGEFAWSLFEPEEGRFCFDLFDDFLALAEKTSIRVIMGTPTATPPAWLTERYPETLNASVDGTLYRHGMRRHYNYTSAKYQELTERIVTEMAKHFGHHAAVCGWQVDNELNCETNDFFAESDHAAFRAYVRDKYQTLERLNEAWGTTFWSQTYTDWSQIYLRRPAPQSACNPSMALDSCRFISQACIRYCALQSDVLRKHIAPEQFITTNGCFGRVDYPEMVEKSLDFLCYDSYPAFGLASASGDPLRDRMSSWQLTAVRAVCPTFGIMEQQSGAGGWNCRMTMPMPRPGQMRLWTFQSIANGADFISYFRWRTCSYGTEIYWHGLNDYSNQPNRRLDELTQIAGDFKRLSDIAGARYQAGGALVCDYDNEWDGETDIWHGPMRAASERNFFAAATKTHTPLDKLILRADTTLEELTAYRALIYPHPTITDEQTVRLLTDYVRQGGRLLIGARAGYKDRDGHCPMRPMPGLLAALCGAHVSDYTMVSCDNEDITIALDGQKKVLGFIDILSPNDAATEIVAEFANDFCKGAPACVAHTVGEGRVWLYGSGFTEEAACAWLDRLGVKEPYADLLSLPETCEIACRIKDGAAYYFVLNYDRAAVELELKQAFTDVLTERLLAGRVELPGYGVLVLRK